MCAGSGVLMHLASKPSASKLMSRWTTRLCSQWQAMDEGPAQTGTQQGSESGSSKHTRQHEESNAKAIFSSGQGGMAWFRVRSRCSRSADALCGLCGAEERTWSEKGAVAKQNPLASSSMAGQPAASTTTAAAPEQSEQSRGQDDRKASHARQPGTLEQHEDAFARRDNDRPVERLRAGSSQA
jgi:hypothetical protein